MQKRHKAVHGKRGQPEVLRGIIESLDEEETYINKEELTMEDSEVPRTKKARSKLRGTH